MDGSVGEVRLFAGTYVPANWKLCDGETIKISANAQLFSVIGKQYGGDGRTDFALPNLEANNGVNYIICVHGDTAARN